MSPRPAWEAARSHVINQLYSANVATIASSAASAFGNKTIPILNTFLFRILNKYENTVHLVGNP